MMACSAFMTSNVHWMSALGAERLGHCCQSAHDDQEATVQVVDEYAARAWVSLKQLEAPLIVLFEGAAFQSCGSCLHWLRRSANAFACVHDLRNTVRLQP